MSVSSSSSSSASSNNDDVQDSTTMRVPPFVVDQRVFANDSSGSLYEAIVRKASWTGQHWTFLVHYLGWNARWDKWLEETHVYADTLEMRQKSQQEQHKRKRTSPEETPRKKRVERGPSYADYCELPFTLKTILVQDREKVMRLGFDAPLDCNVTKWRPAREVHHLPARISVKTVLDHYVKCKRKEHDDDDKKALAAEQKARAFVQDVAMLFDETLATCLLYPPERAQHEAIQAHSELSQKRKCELYGCEFLLRFLVRLPVLLEESGNRKELGSQIADLIVLLQKNRQACFKGRYREPNMEELNDYEKALRNGAVAMDEWMNEYSTNERHDTSFYLESFTWWEVMNESWTSSSDRGLAITHYHSTREIGNAVVVVVVVFLLAKVEVPVGSSSYLCFASRLRLASS